MMINYFSEINSDSLKEQLEFYDRDNSVKGILLLACDANGYNHFELDSFLRSIKKPLFGGVFPGIILNDCKYDTGFLIMTLEKPMVVKLIENISDPQTDFDEELMSVSEQYSSTRTMFVFVDGFSKRIGDFIESIFTIFGLEFSYLGGGAGSLAFKQKPCVFSNKGLLKDCAIIAGVELQSEIGVKHGWESIAGPYKITSADHNKIRELDFMPAFELYKKVVEKHSSLELTRDNFFELAKAYPFGITKMDAESVVRDPIFVESDNSLCCVGEVQMGAYVNILTGNKEMLIKAAGKAIETSMLGNENPPKEFVFFIECVSRVLFLKEDFKEELKEVLLHSKGIPLIGVLTLGEIANNGKDYLEFYNKTSVIGCF